MVAHEYAHGYVAYRNGDPTAFQLGRLTWNPIKHIDPFMTIILPILTFVSAGVILGGAKPVPVNPRNYRNFKRGDILVSLAGIATNVVLAALCVPIIIVLGLIGRAAPAASETLSLFQAMFLGGIFINLILAAFNLIPIPPLDGSHVLKYLLPPAWGLAYQRIGRYGLLIVIILLSFGSRFLNIWLAPVYYLVNLAERVVIPFILVSQWTM
jgi:Zn-dependent protease